MLQSGGKFRRKMSGRFGNFTRAGPAPRGEAKWSACPVGRHNPAPCLQTCAHFLELSPVCTGLYTGILDCADRLPARNPGTLPTKRQKFWRFPQPVQEAVPRPDAAERHGRAAARVAGERSVRQRCRALLFGLSRPLCRGGPRVPARRSGGHDHDGQRSRGPAACIPFHRRGRGAHHHRRHRPGRLSAAARPAGRRALPARLRRLPRGADAGA